MSQPTPLRVVFFGTPEIAVPTLEALIAGPHAVVGVVSQPDRGRGRGRQRSASPVSQIALREDIPLLRPDRVGETETVDALRSMAPDIGVVVAFGQFLPKRVRELPTRGYLINAHASLLPRYRGAAPIARAILEGEVETGISIMRVEKEMDAGPVAAMERISIEPTENTQELSTRLAELAARAVSDALDQVARGSIQWRDQDASRATLAAKLEKHDAVLDLRESASALAARIHAVSPKPGGAVTLVGPEGDETLLKISRAESEPYAPGASPKPGTPARAAGLKIAAGDGWLVPLVLQRPGGRPLPVADFLRGFALPDDARFAVLDAAPPRSEPA